MKIYHNPRCRKSRETLNIIESAGTTPEIIEYLKDPPSIGELTSLLKKLNMSPDEIIRKGERLYKENYRGNNFTDLEWIEILTKNPILIERPIIVEGENAVIGRPPENVKQLLSSE